MYTANAQPWFSLTESMAKRVTIAEPALMKVSVSSVVNCRIGEVEIHHYNYGFFGWVVGDAFLQPINLAD